MMKPKSSSSAVKSTTKHYKCSLSLPADLAVDLNRLAKRFGMSQSALVTILLSRAFPPLEEIMDKFPIDYGDEKARRFRGASADILEQAVADVLKEI